MYDALLHDLRDAREKEQTVADLLENDPSTRKHIILSLLTIL